MRKILLALAMMVCSTTAAAQAEKSIVRTSSGVDVTIHSDDFAGRYEYTAPKIKVGDDGYAFVAVIVENGQAKPATVLGNVVYRGEWRRYYTAIFRGGEEVDAVFGDRDVLSCSGSRYSRGCLLSEGFQLTIKPDEVVKYANGPDVQVQLRAQAGGNVIVDIPIVYYHAVLEAAGVAKPLVKPTEEAALKPAQKTDMAPGVNCLTCR